MISVERSQLDDCRCESEKGWPLSRSASLYQKAVPEGDLDHLHRAGGKSSATLILELSMDEHRDPPVRLDYFRLVKRLNEHLASLGQERIDEDIQEAWAGYFQEMALTQDEIDTIGPWYSKHYSISLSIPSLRQCVEHLRRHSTLPDRRITGGTESDAVAILEACAALELDRYRLSDALFQAAALVHHAAYRVDLPNIDPEYIRQEIEGRARLADYFSRDILNEAQKGVGAAAKLGRTLFPRH